MFVHVLEHSQGDLSQDNFKHIKISLHFGAKEASTIHSSSGHSNEQNGKLPLFIFKLTFDVVSI